VGALLGRDGAAALEAVDRAATAGEDLGTLGRETVELLRRLLVTKVAPAASFVDLTPAEVAELRATAEPISADELIYVLRAFLDADAEMRRSPHPRVELEIAAVRATRRPQPQAIETLIGKLEEAEKRLRQLPPVSGSAGGGRPVVVQETLLDARPAPAAPPRSTAPAPAVSGSSGRPHPAAPLIEAAAADIGASEPTLPPPTEPGLEAAWERVVADVMKRKAVLGSVLQHATPLRVEDGVLTLALQASGFHREMLSDRSSKELINEAVQRHVAAARRFELDTNGGGAGGAGARSHPAVQAALSTFQADVVAVRPRSPEEGEKP
jgi:DNA polymerase-3 subunit gamma/tau